MFSGDRTFIIAEAGINHNGSLDIAKQLIDAAVEAGCSAIKFQKRTPALSLSRHLWDQERDTPWGQRMSYLAYRERIELSKEDYFDLANYCLDRGIMMSASPWDLPSAEFLNHLKVPFIKIASASVTNLDLVARIGSFKRPVVMSTGMSTLADIERAVKALGPVPELALLVCTSTYPAMPADLNLARIHALQDHFANLVIGYSGHEPGLWTTLCAVAMGARVIERHITLDRSLPGTDQAASIEPAGLKKLVKEIRNFEAALGSPEIGVLECEKPSIARLRPAELA